MLIQRPMSQTQKRLQELYSRLDKNDQESLLAFAEFLLTRSAGQTLTESAIPSEPELAPRPEDETVVAAIKRLSKSYSMLESGKLLNETSTLMTQHVMQGRDAAEVIDDLEALFRRLYQESLDSKAGTQ